MDTAIIVKDRIDLHEEVMEISWRSTGFGHNCSRNQLVVFLEPRQRIAKAGRRQNHYGDPHLNAVVGLVAYNLDWQVAALLAESQATIARQPI